MIKHKSLASCLNILFFELKKELFEREVLYNFHNQAGKTGEEVIELKFRALIGF